jgi:hypothetical protein
MVSFTLGDEGYAWGYAGLRI